MWEIGRPLCCCFCLATKLCPTLCYPMDCSTPGLPVPHYLPEFAQVHVHWIGDAIQLPHPLLPSSPFALNLSQHQSLFQWVGSYISWWKYWSFNFSISPSNEHVGLISLRTDFIPLLSKEFSRVFSSTTVLRCSRITALSWWRGLRNSMKLWGIPCNATQDGWIIVESSDKTWSTEGGNGKPLQYSCCENPMNSIKRPLGPNTKLCLSFSFISNKAAILGSIFTLPFNTTYSEPRGESLQRAWGLA